MINVDDFVFVVKYYDIYDFEHTEFILGIASSKEYALDIIRSNIRNVAASYSCNRYSIERWALNEYDWGCTVETVTKEQNIEIAKEIGVYLEED